MIEVISQEAFYYFYYLSLLLLEPFITWAFYYLSLLQFFSFFFWIFPYQPDKTESLSFLISPHKVHSRVRFVSWRKLQIVKLNLSNKEEFLPFLVKNV